VRIVQVLVHVTFTNGRQLITLTVVVEVNQRVTSTLSVHGERRYVSTMLFGTCLTDEHAGERWLQDEVQEEQAHVPRSRPAAQPRQAQATLSMVVLYVYVS
jgi:hypothetical protein